MPTSEFVTIPAVRTVPDDDVSTTPLGSPAAGHIIQDAEPITPLSIAKIIQQSLPYSVLCYIARRLLTILLNRLLSVKAKATPESHQKRVLRVALYILSTAMATVGSWYSVSYMQIADGIRALPETSASEVDSKREKKSALQKQTTSFMEFLLGYLMHDTASTIDQFREYPADMVHHGIGMTMSILCLSRPHLLMDFVPAFLRLEGSTVALNWMWFFREFPILAQRFPFVDRSLPKVFVALYASIRMVWFPWYLHHVATKYPIVWNQGLGPAGRGLFYLLHTLQTYWFGLIVQKMVVS